jgi:hypothetical protein
MRFLLGVGGKEPAFILELVNTKCVKAIAIWHINEFISRCLVGIGKKMKLVD